MSATTVSYTTEEFVRRAVGRALAGRYQGRALCSSCLVGLTLERLHAGWRRSEVEVAMGKVFEKPGVLTGAPAGPCARCQRPLPCLGHATMGEGPGRGNVAITHE